MGKLSAINYCTHGDGDLRRCTFGKPQRLDHFGSDFSAISKSE